MATTRRSSGPDNIDAIVIGSGIGGLGLAALLSRAGKRVLVLEKHYRPGGCTHAFDEVGDNVFDSGIHYVGGGPLMQRMLAHVCDFPQEWAKMGSAADGYVYDTFDFGDDSRYDPPSQDAHWWEHEPHLHYLRAGRLEESLTRQFPEEASGIRSYLREVDRAMQDVLRAR